MQFDRAKPIDFRMSPVLPLVYDDALSYYEAIAKVYERVNMLTSLVESFDVNETFIKQSKDYTDAVVAKVRQDYDERLAALSGELNALQYKHNQDISVLHDMILKVERDLRAEMLRLYTIVKDIPFTIDSKMEIVKVELEEFIKDYMGEPGSVMVTSPPTGQRVPIQQALYDLYGVIVGFWSLTAQEYDELQLTAAEYDNLNLTAYDYDNLARWFLWDMYKNRMISPFTGKMEPYSVIINQLADLHKEALTAAEYDALGLTALAYDNKKLTAYQYDWFGKTYLA